MLAWIVERTAVRADAATTTPIGNVPAPGCARHRRPRRLTPTTWPSCCGWTPTSGAHEVPLIREHYARFGDRLPVELAEQLDALERRLG